MVKTLSSTPRPSGVADQASASAEASALASRLSDEVKDGSFEPVCNKRNENKAKKASEPAEEKAAKVTQPPANVKRASKFGSAPRLVKTEPLVLNGTREGEELTTLGIAKVLQGYKD